MTTPRNSRCPSEPSPTNTKSTLSASSASDSASPQKEADKPKGVRVVCSLCGKPYLKKETRIRENNFCCKAHLRSWNSRRMSDYNRLTNPMNRPGGVLESRVRRGRELRGKKIFQVQRSCPPWLCCIVPAHTKLYKYTIMHAIGH